MTRSSQVIKATRESNQKYKIQIEATDNKCIHIPSKAGKDCQMYAVINCETEKDCLYELFFDHLGSQIVMKPKVMYSNVITEGEIDKYEIHITDEGTENLAIILNQNTGHTKLKFAKFISIKIF
jgi:hypothetical protein